MHGVAGAKSTGVEKYVGSVPATLTEKVTWLWNWSYIRTKHASPEYLLVLLMMIT